MQRCGVIVANHLKTLTMNFVVYFTIQSNAEVERILKSRAFYINAENKLAYSATTETLEYVISAMHKLGNNK